MDPYTHSTTLGPTKGAENKDRDADGVEGEREKVPPPQPTRGLGSMVKLTVGSGVESRSKRILVKT